MGFYSDENVSNKIGKEDLLELVDMHFHGHINNQQYQVFNIEAAKLLTHNRLDLAIKFFYLQMKQKQSPTFAKTLYINHIKAFSLGTYVEPGNAYKNTIQQYISDFDEIYKSVKEKGIDKSESLIPLSRKGSIANGAHRVSAAYMANIKVPAIRLDMPDDEYDFNFFIQRGMSQAEIEISVTKFIELAENCHVALVWPSAQGHQDELDALIPNIIYKSRVSLKHRGGHNLLSQVYYDEEWLGRKDENYPGVENKLVQCFKTFDDLRIVAFQEESLEKILLLKEKIRQIFSIGKHSVHISDTKEEAIRIARILFNENSVHFLNYAEPNKFLATDKKLKRFKKFVSKNNFQPEDVILDTSIILSLYGVRECNDIDYLSFDIESLKYKDDLIDEHTLELGFHDEDRKTLIFDPAFYFYYDDLKFISFHQLYRMKKNRAEEKDNNDLALMAALIEHNVTKKIIATIRQKYYFLKVKTKIRTMELLRVIGLYEFARAIYRAIKD